MKVAGLIFSNMHDGAVPELTRFRTMASIPFGARYRLIDFPLSNMVNSGIVAIGIITHYNYRSLLDHVGSGKDYDLSRRSGGIKFLPPYITTFDSQSKAYETRLEALESGMSFIKRCDADYIVMSDCDVLMNIDLKKVVDEHIESSAYITLVTTIKKASGKPEDVVTVSENNKISDMSRSAVKKGEVEVPTGVSVMARRDLEALLALSKAHAWHDFSSEPLRAILKKKLIRAIRFDGYSASISSLEDYFEKSMELLRGDVRDALFNPERPIYTKLKNTPPTRYLDGARVKNSLVADGAVIEGEVENSILFRGVHVGKGAVVRNSILLQDTAVLSGASLNAVVTDKNVTVKPSRVLSGHETMPFFIPKGESV